ncbi:pyrroloquinoline quinone precursor peptide PqqA [Actinomadura syzygii]|uniref:Coenzyme PQQ synthesis protein A n=1 Tax=Actinomadura syzygii TaxID=1427538 RepID=A0A5D0UI67_9ACTN|nr:pyrroloquinoline quinone precursor peptide PqqA [Actinomadura syzygii]
MMSGTHVLGMRSGASLRFGAPPGGRAHPAPQPRGRCTMTENTWVTPDYEIVETSMEVTAYLTDEG